MSASCDYLIIGAGVIGLSIGISILESDPAAKVIVVDKESKSGTHASARNSGVLHAGFYYSPESLKAKFCKEGNLELRKVIKKSNIPIREVGKVVVAQNEEEATRLISLFERGTINGVELELHDESKLVRFEPLAKTSSKFLWSPTTAISDPSAVTKALESDFLSMGGQLDLSQEIELEITGGEVRDKSRQYSASYIINSAGAHADRIAKSVEVSKEYAMIPFIGTYFYAKREKLPLQRLVYPVPHKINPFLGVHFTLTLDGSVKIGPSAVPVFGREQYNLSSGWNLSDITQSLKGMASLAIGDSHSIMSMIRSEIPSLYRSGIVAKAGALTKANITASDWARKPPGIRAQLVHLDTGKLEQDFKVISHLNSTHILNAVSPGWTSAIPFARYVAQNLSK
jgi:L-2-hydroxyglutarate oxidase